MKSFATRFTFLPVLFAHLLYVCAASAVEDSSATFVFWQSDVTDELSQRSVRKIYQDSLGFIWILTSEGLHRYDGVGTTIFRADVSDDSTLSSDNLQSVAEDGDGNLWFGTQRGGINKFDRVNQSFQVFSAHEGEDSFLLADGVGTLDAGSDGLLWVGYLEGGVTAFNPNTKAYRHFTPAKYPLLSSTLVTKVLQTSSREVFVATVGNGLLRLDLLSGSISKFAGIASAEVTISSDQIYAVHMDPLENIWIGTSDSGLYMIDKYGSVKGFRTVSDISTGEPIDIIEVNDFLESSDGRLLVATGYGLAAFNQSRTEVFAVPIRGRSSAPLFVNSIIQDSTGLYWAGGYSGIVTGFRTAIKTLNIASGLPDENVLSVATLESGDPILGTVAGLHLAQDGEEVGGNDLNLPRTEKSPITCLLVEERFIWMGTFHMGLIRYDFKTGSSVQYFPDAELGLNISHNQITSIYRDSNGDLWVGSYAGGLNRMRAGEESFEHYEHDPFDEDTISNNFILVIFQEKNGDLWVGTEYGLNRFDYETETFESFLHDPDTPGGMSSPEVNSIHEDSKARLWIGTQGGGLNMWEPVYRKQSIANFSYFQSNIGLPSSTVYAIQGDDEGNIWLATSGGLTRFNYDTGDSRNFTVDDGLQSNDFNFGASHRDSAGRLYFGGTSGLNIFDPSEIQVNTEPPRISLTRVALGNEPVWFDRPYSELEKIELEPDDYLLGLSFAVMDFRAPHRNRYRYQMVGLDQHWVDLGNRSSIDFSKLPMGEYVLRVQGANPDGIWSPEGIVLDIVVHPPLYFTWYAFVAYAIAALTLVAIFIYQQRLRQRRQLAYQWQLEEDVRSRTRDLRRSNEKLQIAVDEIGRARHEAVDANQAKSEFLAALSHEIRTPMHGVLGMTDLLLHSGLSERQHGFAESAHNSANELLGLIDNILDFSKIEAGKLELEETTFNLREEMENLCYLYAELAQGKNLELNLIFNADLRRQLYGDPVRLRQILQNLLSNSIKFTRRGTVNLFVDELSRQGKQVELVFLVEDSGIGMDHDTIQRVLEPFSQADSSTTRQYGGTGLGLSIARQLVELMGGALEVVSKPGVGTTMRFGLTLMESPIYTDLLSTSVLEEIHAEVVAPVPETRTMFKSQLAALDIPARACEVVEDLSPLADKRRLVLIDVASLYDSGCVAQVANIAEDPASLVLLVTPLSGHGIPEELAHLPHTTKPVRSASLVSDILSAESDVVPEAPDQPTLLRFDQRILLVEDITANQEIARAMLESFGCSVAIARNGEIALEMIQHDAYDFVLMDCQMPVMDGFEATRCLRQYEAQHPERGRVPVVALTAGKTETEKERCFASGMDRILFKPYSTAELNGMLAQYFDPCGVVGQTSVEEIESRELATDLLDETALKSIRSIDVQGGGALLAKVFENFKQDAAEKVEELRANSKDPAVLVGGAHAVKSMSLNLGAKALSDYCRLCEAQWKAGTIDDAPRQIEVLAGHLHDAVNALERLVETDEAEY